MAEDLIPFDLPVDQSSIIKVIGVGGGGGNAVNHMFQQGIKDVNFVVCNTDSQALDNSPVKVKIQLGESLTEGRGAGNQPDIGKQAAIENLDDVIKVLGSNTKMVFITAGMGGGTGTGAAPVIAKAAKEMDILTIAIVTIPFKFEGPKRINQAIDGISELEKHVDSLLVINNQKLMEVCDNMKFSEGFSFADNILAAAAKGIAEIITVHGYINVDFADVHTVLADSGVALMGTGSAEGEDRAVKAVQEALNSPLLNDNKIIGTENILLNISSGNSEITMAEIGEISDYVNNEVGSNPNIIWGTGKDESLEDKISITIIATGFESNSIPELYAKKIKKKKVILNDDDFDIAAIKRNKKINPNKDESLEFTQRTIDFDIKKDRETEKYFVDNKYGNFKDVKKTSEKLAEIESLKEKKNSLGGNQFSSAKMKFNIDDMENVPAFERNKIKIEQTVFSKDSKVSRYTLSDDEENSTVKINENNSYLHDNVD